MTNTTIDDFERPGTARDTTQRRGWLVAALCLATLAATPSLAATNCPGNPGALGTSRTLVVDPREHPRIGTMQYPETLPLRDHEVVLTFDDGPIPKYSNQIIAMLAAECVKANFFIIGRMAKEFPDGVRKLIASGHTVGTHSQNHPLSMNRMPIERAKQEIDDGIASTAAALGDPKQLAPFFRIPGLLRATTVEDYLTSQGLQTWSADFPADDWRHVSPQKVHDLAMSRLAAKGRGILLLHDIQPRTVAALPQILRDLKAGGYRIVHVVPATPDLPKTPTEAQQWHLHPISESIAISRWPAVPHFVFSDAGTVPAPGMSKSDQMMPLTEAFDHARRFSRRDVPLPQPAPWPRQWVTQPISGSTTLPVPAQTLFQIAEKTNVPLQVAVALPHRAELVPAFDAKQDDGIARLISIDASATKLIPGSLPATPPDLPSGIQPTP